MDGWMDKKNEKNRWMVDGYEKKKKIDGWLDGYKKNGWLEG